MRHQATNRTPREQIAGHAAEHPFVEPAMAVRSGDQKIDVFVTRPSEDLIRARAASLHFDLALRLYPVLREVANDVVNMAARCFHPLLLAYFQDGYALGLMKER
jgi:hypothetical protein